MLLPRLYGLLQVNCREEQVACSNLGRSGGTGEPEIGEVRWGRGQVEREGDRVRREGREEGAGITKSFLLKITIDYCRNY